METKLLPSLSERWEELYAEHYTYDVTRLVDSINQFHNFLKQEPKLYMFVPCDDDGNVLEEPESPYPFATPEEESEYEDVMKQYQQALDRVIFDEFEVKDWLSRYALFDSDNPFITVFKDTGKFFWDSNEIKTLADLSDKVYLNENGIKQAGIN